MSRMAGTLNRTDDALHFDILAANTRASYHVHWYNTSSGSYVMGAQTSNLLPLQVGATPPPLAPTVVANLVRDIVTTHDTHLTVGAVGTRWILQTLSAF